MPRAVASSLLLALMTSGSLAGCPGELQVSGPMPVADAGFDQIRALVRGTDPPVVDIDATASCDPLDPGAALVGRWRVVDAPDEAQPLRVDTDASGLRAHFTAAVPGSYRLVLLVSNADRTSEPDELQVDVLPADTEADVDELVLDPPDINACGGPVE